jgi:hypothetical protein
MTAVAKGAVDRDCTRPRGERGEDFRHHDGTMEPAGVLPEAMTFATVAE